MRLLKNQELLKALKRADCELRQEDDGTLCLMSDYLTFDPMFEISNAVETADDFLDVWDKTVEYLVEHPDAELLQDFEMDERDDVWTRYLEELRIMRNVIDEYIYDQNVSRPELGDKVKLNDRYIEFFERKSEVYTVTGFRTIADIDCAFLDGLSGAYAIDGLCVVEKYRR